MQSKLPEPAEEVTLILPNLTGKGSSIMVDEPPSPVVTVDVPDTASQFVSSLEFSKR